MRLGLGNDGFGTTTHAHWARVHSLNRVYRRNLIHCFPETSGETIDHLQPAVRSDLAGGIQTKEESGDMVWRRSCWPCNSSLCTLLSFPYSVESPWHHSSSNRRFHTKRSCFFDDYPYMTCSIFNGQSLFDP